MRGTNLKSDLKTFSSPQFVDRYEKSDLDESTEPCILLGATWKTALLDPNTCYTNQSQLIINIFSSLSHMEAYA